MSFLRVKRINKLKKKTSGQTDRHKDSLTDRGSYNGAPLLKRDEGQGGMTGLSI